MCDVQDDVFSYTRAVYAESDQKIAVDDDLMFQWVVDQIQLPELYPFDGEDYEEPILNIGLPKTT